ncbi:type II methionyl aminopeptidase [Methanonatronarchaeum sp. AMET-Sl]|uniref:type II methionyl aminopeptidase n=1 Tax=Methanonatronarchaeum sp. AMET-Sl TaxID=3037654 RepID=UPI00244E1DF7|nr:type II methionyl aminopeptidase [Methanonatronarchaeum sp. AMET-Sl]WGI17296.1 type II methionyl aminopeptidase [Methanonatronarchaeum sp. AMET-Sl]
MPNNNLKKTRKAGKILREVKKEIKPKIKIDTPVIEIAEQIENQIKQKGGKPAFPCNISINNLAAHYTPTKNDQTKIQKGDLVKIDIGVHIDGYIADSAFTIDQGNNQKLVEATEKALQKAIETANNGAGTPIKEISSAIEYEIKKRDLQPVVNLTGHGLNQWNTHVNPSIPNIKTNNNHKLKEGQVIAIEPFATNGSGRVKEKGKPEIYSLKNQKTKTRNRKARKLLKTIKKQYKTLPFAKRWLQNKKHKKLDYTLKKLTQQGALRSYAPLYDKQNSKVSQAEHTIIIHKNKAEKIT